MAREFKTGFILTGDSKGAVNSIKLTKDAVDKLNTTTKRAAKETGSAFDSLKASLFSVQGAVTALATGAFAVMLKNTIDAGDEIQKLSQRIGASTEALSQYRHVADLTGVTFNQLTMGWQRQTRRIAEAAAGTGEAKKALEELGLSAKALAKLAPEKQFEILADAITGVAEESDRVRLAQKLWDSEGVKLLQTIKGGSSALKEMREEADRLGMTLSQDSADAMAEFNDQLTIMSNAAQGFGQSVATWMIPALSNLLGYLSSASEGIKNLLMEMGVIEQKTKSYIAGARLGIMKEIQSLEKAMAGIEEMPGVGGMIAGALGIGIDQDKASKRLFDLHVQLADLNDEMRSLQQITSTPVPAALNATVASIAKVAKGTKAASKSVDTFAKDLQSLIDELEPLEKKTREYLEDVELLNRAWVEGVISGEEYERLIFNLASGVEETAKKTEQAAVVMTKSADPFAEAWIGAIERMDNGFVEMWKGTLDGFEGFADSLKNAFIQLMAELAHEAITRPLIIQPMMSAFGVGGTGTMATGGMSMTSMPFGSIANLASGLFGGGAAIAGGTAGASSLLGAGGASLAGNFIAGGSGIATAGASAGLGAGVAAIGAAMPYIGAAIAIANMLGLFGGDVPSPHFGATGELGKLVQNYERDLDDQQSQQVTEMIAALNASEQAFYDMLTDTQKEALEGYTPPDLMQVHFESEHELAAHMLFRAQEALKVADAELGQQWTDAVNEIWSTRGAGGGEFFTMDDYNRLLEEFIVTPFLETQAEMEQAAADLAQKASEWAERMESRADEIRARIADLAGVLGSAGGLRESINADLIAFGGRDAATLESMRSQVFGDLDATDLDAVRERLELANEYRELVVSTFNQQIADVEALAAAEKQRVEAANAAGAALLQWVSAAWAGTSSPLGPGQRTAAAGDQYQTILAMARAGDMDAAGRLTGSASTYLSELRGTSATALDYARSFGGVTGEIGGLGKSLSGMVYDEETWRGKIVDLEKEANAYLLELDEKIATVEETLSAQTTMQEGFLQEILDALETGFKLDDGTGTTQDGSSLAYGGQPHPFSIPPGTPTYIPPGGVRPPAPEGYYWTNTDIGSELRPDIGNAPPPSASDFFIPSTPDRVIGPGFASGGVASGPASGYGVTLHGTEAVIPLDRGHVPLSIDFSELVAELRDLRRETAMLRQMTSKQTYAALKNSDIQDKWDRDGMPAERVL